MVEQIEIIVDVKGLVDYCFSQPNGNELLKWALSDATDEFIDRVLEYIEANYGK